jgi:hypothetical protein
MRAIRPPRPQEIVAGATFGRVSIHPGKHGDGDFQVRWNGLPITFDELAAVIVALYVAEERYLQSGKRGGEYFVSAFLSPVVHWCRNHLGKPMALPSPDAPLGDHDKVVG